jgi:hypothetical protein
MMQTGLAACAKAGSFQFVLNKHTNLTRRRKKVARTPGF